MECLKNFLILTLIVVTTFSCSSNDDGEAGNNGSDNLSTDNLSKIQGTWFFLSRSTDGVVDPLEDCETFNSFTFEASFVSVQVASGSDCNTTESTAEDYSINGNILNVGGFTVEIITLNSSTLIVGYTEDGDEIIEVYDKQ